MFSYSNSSSSSSAPTPTSASLVPPISVPHPSSAVSPPLVNNNFLLATPMSASSSYFNNNNNSSRFDRSLAHRQILQSHTLPNAISGHFLAHPGPNHHFYPHHHIYSNIPQQNFALQDPKYHQHLQQQRHMPQHHLQVQHPSLMHPNSINSGNHLHAMIYKQQYQSPNHLQKQLVQSNFINVAENLNSTMPIATSIDSKEIDCKEHNPDENVESSSNLENRVGEGIGKQVDIEHINKPKKSKLSSLSSALFDYTNGDIDADENDESSYGDSESCLSYNSNKKMEFQCNGKMNSHGKRKRDDKESLGNDKDSDNNDKVDGVLTNVLKKVCDNCIKLKKKCKKDPDSDQCETCEKKGLPCHFARQKKRGRVFGTIIARRIKRSPNEPLPPSATYDKDYLSKIEQKFGNYIQLLQNIGNEGE